MRKIWRRVFIALLVLFVILFIVIARIVTPVSDESLRSIATEYHLRIQIDTFYFRSNAIRVCLFRSDNSPSAPKPLLVGVHGAPGDISTFLSYVEQADLIHHFDILLYDRPGYGDNQNYLPVLEQAQCLVELLSLYGEAREIELISHSFGGPIAALAGILGKRLAIKHHYMVSPVICPEERVFWFSGLPTYFPLKYLFRHSWLISAEEKCDHPNQMRLLADEWEANKIPTIHFHGTNDWLAPADNYIFTSEHFPKAYYLLVLWEGANHFVIWSRIDEIKAYLLE
jgi:pimeloyl-ACP methyl ester carboxylesterase